MTEITSNFMFGKFHGKISIFVVILAIRKNKYPQFFHSFVYEVLTFSCFFTPFALFNSANRKNYYPRIFFENMEFAKINTRISFGNIEFAKLIPAKTNQNTIRKNLYPQKFIPIR